MNEKMERILTRGSEHDVLHVEIDPIVKPSMLSCSSPSIYIDGPYFFYTFDGRSLFFSRDQSEPIISVPEETGSVCMTSLDGVEYCFTLSLKNKLECLVNGPGVPDKKYCVTRNVQQVEKTNGRICFIFRKDRLYFINECHFDGKKWIGKILHANIEGESVELFATDGSFFFAKDGRLYNACGDDMGVDASFAHKTGDILVVGNQEEHGYMFRILDSSMGVVDSVLVPKMERGVIKAHQDIIVQQMHSELYVLQATREGFVASGCIRHIKNVLCFDVKSLEDHVCITLLTSEECGKQTTAIQGNDILQPADSEESRSRADCDADTPELDAEGQDWRSLDSRPSNTSDSSDAESGFFYDSSKDKLSGLREIESMSLESNASHHSIHRPKNKLLEEVRATLSKRRQPESNALADGSPETDRFVAYAKQEGALRNPQPEPQPSDILSHDEHGLSKPNASQSGKLPEDSPSSNRMPKHSPAKKDKAQNAVGASNVSAETRRTPLCEPSPGAMLGDTVLEQLLAEHRRMSIETKKETVAAVQTALTKTGGIEAMVRDVIVKTVVPLVEASFNEMRIQILAEVRKLLSNVPGQTSPRASSIQKLINAGKINQAIQELMRLEEPEMEAVLDLFSCSSIENADSNILVQFLGKIFSLAKKQPKDAHFMLITACLLDIEVNDLTIESMQSMSVLLRYLKEMDSLDDEKYNELNCLVDIAIKKIRKRAKHHPSKCVQ